MAVAGGGAIDRLAQVKHLDDAARTQVEVFAYQCHDGLVAELACAKGVDGDRGGLGHTDGVAHLNLTLAGQASSNNVLGDIATGVSRAAVHFGRIFAGERATTVTGHAAIGVHNDLAASEATVAHGAADHEDTGGVDVVQGVLVQPLFRQYRFDDFFHHGFAQLGQLDLRRVLGGQHHGLHGHRLAVVIAQGDLALGVRTQPRQGAVLAQFCLTLHQTVREIHRCRHQGVGFVGGKAEHQALIACAQILVFCFVHADGDIGRLLANAVQYCTAGTVEAFFGTVVTDVQDHLANDVFQFHIGIGTYFTGDNGHAGFHQGFHGNACLGVILDDGIQNGVRDLVSHFIGMAFGHGLGGKDGIFTHCWSAPWLLV